MPVALLSTKLYIPTAREDAVARPRLTGKLLSIKDRPGGLALLSGPAGFGKTTLLSELVACLQQPVAWLSLDEGDNDPVRFWSYLIAACQTVQPGMGVSAQAMLQSPAPLPAELIPTILINDIAGLNRGVVLVLDDYHTIHNDIVHAALSFLLEHIPGKMHVVVSTRSDPPWPLARFRARNRLIEVRAQDLRFTTAEAAAFLNQMMGLDLTAEDVAALEERTEGWVAGLQLAALSMQGRSDLAGFIRAFTGSHIYIAEYLVEEVLQRQPQEVQAFLLQTSILERLSAGLCAAVTGCADAQSMLSDLQRANLFVLPLDDEGQWFRYHHLFADLLQARLRQKLTAEAIAALHSSAAGWYEQAGMFSEAIEHARAAGDYSHFVRLVGKFALPMILGAYFKTVEDWLQVIPPEYLLRDARANMAFAWMHLMRRNFAQAAPYLERLQGMFATSEPGEVEPALRGEWLALQAMLQIAQGNAVESRGLAEQALEILPEEATQVRTMIYMGLADAYQQMLDYERAAQTCERIIQQGRRAGDPASELFGLSYQGRMVLLQGKLHAAGEIASGALKQIEHSGTFSPIVATLYGELAQVYYHWHQLEKARAYFARSVELSTLGGFSDAKIYHGVFLSRLFQMEGDLPASLREIEIAFELMKTAAPSFVAEEVIAQQVSIYLAFDRLTEAQRSLQPYGFAFESPGEGGFSHPVLAPEAGIPHPTGLLYNSALSILLYRSKTTHEPEVLGVGIELAGQVIAGSLRCRHLPIVLKTLLLRGQMQAELGDANAGLADVSTALELAEPEGYISVFVEEGQPVAEMLARLVKQGLPGTVQPAYVQSILSAFPDIKKSNAVRSEQPAPERREAVDSGARDESPVEPLTSRELEVLRLLAAGDSNATIAEKLVITVSAVKKHTGNIYGKLGVNSRTQAIARARQLRLLSPDN